MITLNNVEDENILSDIFNSEITVFEDVQGSKIWLNWDGTQFIIKPRRINNEAINLVDLAMQNYYNSAINYFNTLTPRVRGLMHKNWWFCFEYFPDNQPANIEYNKIPKNGLVLTTINKNGKYNYTFEELIEFSRLFDVEHIPVIFKGVLTDDMKKAIQYFLNTSEKDLEYVFGEQSFSFFFYKLLNSNFKSSYLMDDEFQNNLEKIIIRTSNSESSFQILNPLYKRVSADNSTEFVEVYTLILINFLTFCQSIELESIKVKGSNKDEMYIYLICKLFNIYVSDVKDDLINFDFIVPEFFDKEKFRINKELIDNKLTLTLINESDKLEYIFKIILSSFNKKRKKPIGVFTDNTVILFNNFVEYLEMLVDTMLKRKQEIELGQSGLVDFSSFFDIKYDTDGDGYVYPSLWDEIVSKEDSKKKKKGIVGDKSKDGIK